MRVPFLVSWPAKLKSGESDAVVSSLDFLPTVLAATGTAAPAEKPLDGIDLLPVLSGAAATTSRDLFWCSGTEGGWWAVRSGDWKLVAEQEKIGLFNLAQDVSEKTDLAATNAEKLSELTALHDAWLAEMAPPITGEGKRYGLESTTEGSSKRPKSERKKKKMEREAAKQAEAGDAIVRDSQVGRVA